MRLKPMSPFQRTAILSLKSFELAAVINRVRLAHARHRKMEAVPAQPINGVGGK
jgi:hypothetical protein